ncbi:hypothetical protein ACTWP6_04985 [Mycobacterium sp. 4D054]|uniref:hypothetical protein n=1 Tax=Mycobacterium sp. 4D054 TaxID=3457440 RepID=UPI003FD03521
MRTETGAWLDPMIEAAAATGIDSAALMRQASMPAAEAGVPFLDDLARHTPPGAVARGIDWIHFGHLLRHELGWDDTYPALPDFPELRETA